MHPSPQLIVQPLKSDDKSSVELAAERGDTLALVELLAAQPPSDSVHEDVQMALDIAAQGGHARVGGSAVWFP